jgi:hypothetical protein
LPTRETASVPSSESDRIPPISEEPDRMRMVEFVPLQRDEGAHLMKRVPQQALSRLGTEEATRSGPEPTAEEIDA